MKNYRLLMVIIGWVIPFLLPALPIAIGVMHYGSVRAFRARIAGEAVVVEFPGPDLGRLSSGSTHELSVRIRNLSVSPQLVLGGRFDCTCLSTTASTATIVTCGQDLIIPIRLVLRGEGPKKHKLEFYINTQSRLKFVGYISYVVKG